MNSSPSQDIIDSAILTHRSFQNYDNETIGDNGADDVGDDNMHRDVNVSNKTFNTQRYTRTELHLLRYDVRSRKRPECTLRTELQNLGVWKFNIGNTNQSNGNQSFIEAKNVNGLLANTRSQRSPAARCSGGGGVSSGNTGDHSTSSPSTHSLSHHHANQKTFIDVRSISSSHLMPAFAKRRIIASTLNTSGNSAGNSGANSVLYSGNIPLEARAETPDCSKELNYTARPRGKEYIYDLRYQRNVEHSGFLSPQRRLISGEHERERAERSHDHENSGSATSPVSASSSRHGHHHNNMTSERRIGSGRLLPRDVNWDYRSQEKDKNVSSSINKEVPLTSHQLQQRNSGRFSERSHDRNSSSFTDRRSFERRVVGNSDKHENINSSSSSNTNGTRHLIDSEISSVNTENSSNSHHHQQQPPQTASNTSGNRRNHHYNERNDEPEWFSGGPTSQHDTIELRGFEEIDDSNSAAGGVGGGSFVDVNKINQITRKLSGSSSSRTSSILNLSLIKKTKDQLDNSKDLDNVSKDAECILDDVMKSAETILGGTSQDEETICITGDNNNNQNSSFDSELQNKFEDLLMNANAEAEFNFESYCNLDPLDHTFMRSIDVQIGRDAEIITSSRFSRWFANEHNSENAQSTNGNDTQNEEVNNKNKVITLMEFLQRNKISVLPEGLQPNVAAIPSVEELEASMRKMDSTDSSNDSSNINLIHSQLALTPVSLSVADSSEPSQDVEAFKKLLEQLGSANKHLQPPSLMHMNMLMQQQVNRSTPTVPLPPQLNVMQHAGLTAPSIAQQSIPPHLIKNEEIKKNIKQQHVIQHKYHNHHILPPHLLRHHSISPQQLNYAQVGNHLSVSHISPVVSGQPQQQKQRRLEAQHLFQCVARGEIALSFLERELNNPNSSAHTKDVIATVLRESSRSLTPSTGLNVDIPSQPNVNMNPKHLHPHHLPQQQQQQQQQQNQQLQPEQQPQQQEQQPQQQQEQQPQPQPQPQHQQTQQQHPQQQQKQKQQLQQTPQQQPQLSQQTQQTQQQQQYQQQHQQQPQQQHCVTVTNIVSSNSQISNPLLVTGQSDQRPLSVPVQQGTILPTPRDMHYHTQSILQNALLKKKLEEEHHHDALKRRQDIQKQFQQQSPMIIPPDLVEVQMLEAQQKHLQQFQIANSIPIQQQQQLQQHQQQIQSHTMQQQPRHINSPTPLAFTPTSVLRKMTAEKENTAAPQQTVINQISQQQQQQSQHQQTPDKSIPQPSFVNQQQIIMQQPSLQPRMILGGNHPHQQQQPQQQHLNSDDGTQNSPQQKTSPQLRNVAQVKWPPSHMINQNISVNKPMGRPILKGPLPVLPSQQQQQPLPTSHQQQTSQMAFLSKTEFQQIQQQRLKNNQTSLHISASQSTAQKYPPHPMQHQQSLSPQQNQNLIISHAPQHQQQLFQQQQQQRALVLQRQQQQQMQICHPSQLHHHRSPMDVNIRTMVIAANTNDNPITTDPTTSAGIINYQRDGGLSPTSNQLAQWFSPELLAQASAGKLPLLNMNQALSLEEFERSIQHSSTAVNN